ncbi:MAG: hypothetical protein WBG46_10425 [Nonlabens sp.]
MPVTLPSTTIFIFWKTLMFFSAGFTAKYPLFTSYQLDAVQCGVFFFTGMANFSFHLFRKLNLEGLGDLRGF